MNKVNLAEKLAMIGGHWTPRIVGELNGQHVNLVKFQGEFVWHDHGDEDELFLVLKGGFRMEFRDRSVELTVGAFLIVPKGVEHRPVAIEDVEVMRFEPAAIQYIGEVDSPMTVRNWERI